MCDPKLQACPPLRLSNTTHMNYTEKMDFSSLLNPDPTYLPSSKQEKKRKRETKEGRATKQGIKSRALRCQNIHAIHLQFPNFNLYTDDTNATSLDRPNHNHHRNNNNTFRGIGRKRQ